MHVENLWLLCVALFTLGAMVGYFIFKVQAWFESARPTKFDPVGEENPETASLRLLQKREAEFKNYYQTVTTHYAKTIKLLDRFDGDYKALSQHFQSNVFKVVDRNDLYRALKENNPKVANLSAHHKVNRLMPLKRKMGETISTLKRCWQSVVHSFSTNQEELKTSNFNKINTAKVVSNPKRHNATNNGRADLNDVASSPQMTSSKLNENPIDSKPIEEVIEDRNSLQTPNKSTETITTSQHKNPMKREVLFIHGHKARSSGVPMSDVSIGLPVSSENK